MNSGLSWNTVFSAGQLSEKTLVLKSGEFGGKLGAQGD